MLTNNSFHKNRSLHTIATACLNKWRENGKHNFTSFRYFYDRIWEYAVHCSYFLNKSIIAFPYTKDNNLTLNSSFTHKRDKDQNSFNEWIYGNSMQCTSYTLQILLSGRKQSLPSMQYINRRNKRYLEVCKEQSPSEKSHGR